MVDRSVRRVLIYRLGSLGDMLIALPTLRLVARAFPDARRVLLTNTPVHAKAPAAATVLEGTALIHEYLPYTVGTRSPRELAALWYRILRSRPEIVIYLAASRGIGVAKRDLRFFQFCGAKRIIGVPLTGPLQQNFYGASPESVEAKQQLFSANLEPEAARLARNVAELGDARLRDPDSWKLNLTEAEQQRAAQALSPVLAAPECITVSVGTKVQAKDWGQENWRTLLGRLAAKLPGRGLVLLGSPEEAGSSDFAAQGWAIHGGGPVLNLCGQLTPRESAAAIARSRMFLGHDSGPMHLAAAVGTPLVAIFAARNIPCQWFPFGNTQEVVYHRVECWGCGLETCLEQRKKCIASITVEEVLDRVHALLQRTPSANG